MCKRVDELIGDIVDSMTEAQQRELWMAERTPVVFEEWLAGLARKRKASNDE